jgi:hypothetical protein
MPNIDKQTKMLEWVNRLILTFMVLAVATVAYWVVDPDPLTVEPVGNSFSTCTTREIEFTRYIKSSRALEIHVQNRWHDEDGFMDYNSIYGELVLPQPDFYLLDAGFEKVMTFHKIVPNSLQVGNYLYTPIATYKINPIKTITKKLPSQQVHVSCDYDVNKHQK